MSSATKLVVCYSLGTGAGLDLNLAPMSRQICEDLAEMLALNEDFITVPQFVLVRSEESISYTVDKNACAFAVFYSLPEMHWVLSATKAIGGDIALTGRLIDDDDGLMLSVNMIDEGARLLFCGFETCARDEIHLAVARLAARILSHFTTKSDWLSETMAILETANFHAYSSWMNVRETERRAQREGIRPPLGRIVEGLTYALSHDPSYSRASLKLCEVLTSQLQVKDYDFILRYLEPHYNDNEALGLIVVQSLARLNRCADAEKYLNRIIEKHPENGLFYLIRGSLRKEERTASRDLETARRLLGNDFNGCRTAVDNALISVTGV